MQNNIISIIIPVYNSDKTISHCLESIIKQNDALIEVIIIDDGSVDNSALICKKYSDKYSFIKYYYQKNNGVSCARNNGLSKSNGDYILFLDSDDMLVNNCLNECRNILINNNIDILKFNYYKVNHFVKKYHENYFEKDLFLEKKDYDFIYNSLLSTYKYRNIWGMLIKRNIIRDVKFNCKYTMAEDSLFFYEILKKSNNIYLLNKSLYVYKYNSNSIVHMFNIDYSLKKLNDVLNVNNYIYEDLKLNHPDLLIDNYLSENEFAFVIKNGIKDLSYKEYICLIDEMKKMTFYKLLGINIIYDNRIKFYIKKVIYTIKNIILSII